MARQHTQTLFGARAVGSVLAHGRRAELVDVLARCESRLEDLDGAIGESVAKTSRHELTWRLRDGGVVVLDGFLERAGA